VGKLIYTAELAERQPQGDKDVLPLYDKRTTEYYERPI
jgi:hypothetical protein